MESQTLKPHSHSDRIAECDEPVDHAARGVGRAIAFEVGYSNGVDATALQTARGYALMAGDSLGKDVRSCLRFGNAAAAAFDSLIFEFAIVAIVTTFRSWANFDHLRLQLAEANRGSHGDRRRRQRQPNRTPRSDRQFWGGPLA